MARVISAGPIVIDIPSCAGLGSLEAPNGTIGVLLGLPLGNDRASVHDILARDPNAPNEPVWLFTAKLLLPDERAWVGQHVLRARELARGFLRDETRHYSLPQRASILPSIVMG